MGLQLHEILLGNSGQMRPISCVELEFKDNKYIGNVYVIFLEKYQYDEIINKHQEALKKRKNDSILPAKNTTNSFQHKNSIATFLNKYNVHINKEALLNRICDGEMASILLTGNFEVKSNGLFLIKELYLQALSVDESNIDSVSEIEYSISVQTAKSLERETEANRFNISVQALYTIVKRLFHKDNHHDAKIDDILFVQKNSYFPLKTMHTLGKRIKNIERQILLKKVDNVSNVVSFAEGLVSYSKTFAYENITDKEIRCKQISIHENILSSIHATAKRTTKYITCKESIKNAFILAVGWLLSLSILLIGILNLNLDHNYVMEYSAMHQQNENTMIMQTVSESTPRKGIYSFIDTIQNNIDKSMQFIVFIFTLIFIVPFCLKCTIRYIKNSIGYDRFNIIKNQLNLVIPYVIFLIIAIFLLYKLYSYLPIIFETKSIISIWIMSLLDFFQ